MPDHPFVHRLLELPPAWRDLTALSSAGARLSFAGLGQAMMAFAGWLCERAGVEPGDRVAICLPKNLEAAVAVYGILAAGACYVPLPFYGPAARLADLISSIRPKLLLTTAGMAARLRAINGRQGQPPTILVEPRQDGSGLAPLLERASPLGQMPNVGPLDPAAILFTSGSTGDPKGVMLSHDGILNTVQGMQRRDRMSERDRRISHAGLQIISSLDLFYPLCGCQIFLMPQTEAMFPERLAEVLEREKPTIWSSQATVMRLLLERGDLAHRDLASLRRVAFFGEPMSMEVLRQLMAILPQAEFLNHYGATEAFNIANFFVPRPLPEDMSALPLGVPADHCTMTLRDESGAQVRPGEIGEICVVSPTVMLGYWADPELTAAKRVEGEPNSYRTGDIAIAGEDGMLRLLGRKDNLVKLRGHRFHLGEIEAVLKMHPAVRGAYAFAILDSRGQRVIKAAVLADETSDLETALRRICARRLPAYARPVAIAAMTQFPLLANGKVDRQRLRAIVEGR